MRPRAEMRFPAVGLRVPSHFGRSAFGVGVRVAHRAGMAKRKSGTSRGALTVADAGRKGGTTVRDRYGHEFYEEIGRKGGNKVRDLIAAGKRAMSKRGEG